MALLQRTLLIAVEILRPTYMNKQVHIKWSVSPYTDSRELSNNQNAAVVSPGRMRTFWQGASPSSAISMRVYL